MVSVDNISNNSIDDFNRMAHLDFTNPILFDSFYAKLFMDLDLQCKYYHEISAGDTLKLIKDPFISCFSLNIQSLNAKFSDLKNFISIIKNKGVTLEILALQETWTNCFDRFSLPEYNIFFSARKSPGRGGAAIYSHISLSAVQLLHPCLFIDNIIESVLIKCSTKNNFKFLVVSLYRPNCHNEMNNSQQISTFLEKYYLLLEYLDSFNLPTVLLGDFNLNLFDTNNIESNSSLFLDCCTEFGFIQTVSRATRVTSESATLIDFCLLKDLVSNLILTGVIANDVSDHFATFVALKTNKTRIKKIVSPKRRLINNETNNTFINAFNGLNWQDVLNINCPEIAYNRFLKIFHNFYNLSYPLVNNNLNKNSFPKNAFMTPSLLKCRTKKAALARIAKTNPSLINKTRYKNYRNVYSSAIRTAKRVYTRNKIADSFGDSRKLWNVLKESLNLPNKSNCVSQIIVEGETITDSKKIADNFNSYFASIGPSLAITVPSSTKHFSEYLPPRPENSFYLHPVSPNTMKKYILSMKPKASLDDNNYSMKTLKLVADSISIPMSHIFNLSINTGIFPKKLKVSRCIPIFKSGDPCNVGDYRGVCIINQFSKVWEKIVYDSLLGFLEGNDFFSVTQFGFRRKTSTSHALAAIIMKITEKMNDDKFVLSLMIDIKKCFDVLDREILLKKLERCGVRGICLDWFRSYFSDRRQRVFINGCNSANIEDILYGVLQGSVLGVLLFLVYINDLPSACRTLISFLFADDNTAITWGDNLEDLISLSNNEIIELQKWYNSNKLILHPQKTKCMIFRPPRTNLNLNQDHNGRTYIPLFLNLNEPNENDISKIIPISLVPNGEEQAVKLLGIQLDEKLNFKAHFKQLHTKISRAIFSLRQMRHLLDKKHLLLLYSSYLKSSLDYGSILFCSVNKTTIKPITILQKKAIRIVCNAGFRDHTAPLFKAEKILTFEKTIDYNILRFMYDYKNNLLPPYFEHMWRTNNEIHRYAVRNENDFFIERVNKPFLKCHPLFYFPTLWNSIPEDLKNSESRKIFAKNLNTYLLNHEE